MRTRSGRCITILEPDGSQRVKISLMSAMQTSTCCRHFLKEGVMGDVFHANTLAVLDNGNLLVFDNIDYRRGQEVSRVVEIDPVSDEIHWEFKSSESFPFLSR